MNFELFEYEFGLFEFGIWVGSAGKKVYWNLEGEFEAFNVCGILLGFPSRAVTNGFLSF